MDWSVAVLWIAAAALVLAGVVGSVLPALPGPPLVLAGLLLLAWMDDFSRVGGVTVATVPATHTNAVGPEFLDSSLADALRSNGLNADVGPPVGYVLRFSNGLVAYLSGDTGITAEQDITIRRYYKANLAVMNIGGSPFTTGPDESAFVINELVKPASVIPSHANEVATKGGKLVSGTRTERFIKAVKVPIHLPLSGKTMAFDGIGRCVSGC